MFQQSSFIEQWEDCEEQELWKAFSNDNRDAFSALFLRYYEQLFRYGMSFSTREVVEDGMQKLFFRLWKKRKVIDMPQSIKGYLYVSLRRILLRISKREKARYRRNAKYLEKGIDGILSIEDQIINEEEQEKREELYKHSFKSLTPRQKEALVLRVDEGMSNGEIAEIMGVSDKRVRNLIYEATKKIREEVYNLT